MRASRSNWVIPVVLVVLASFAPPARGQSQRIKDEILKKHRDAMVRYDDFDFEEAKKLLEAAIAQAEENGMEWDPVLARVHLDLGVVYFSGLDDRTAAELQFIKAVEIDAQVEIDPAYGAKEMEALLQRVKRQFGDRGESQDARAAPVDCNAIAGMEHALVESAEAGVDRWIEAFVSERLGAARVALHYRPHGGADAAPEFIAVEMEKRGTCQYVGRIPGHGIRGKVVHYYIAAYNKGGRVIVSRGSDRAPNLMVVEAGTRADLENPLAPTDRAASPRAAAPGRLALGLSLGTGGGYIAGRTEQTDTPIECCFAPELLHLRFEGGYHIAPQTSLSLVFRLGLPLGANIMNHATTAPAALLRLRHTLDAPARAMDPRLVLSAVLGGGVIRETIRIENGGSRMDRDTAAVGPVLVGGGASYVHPLGDRLGLVVGGELLMGLPVVRAIGTTRPQFGIHLDLDVGMVLSF